MMQLVESLKKRIVKANAYSLVYVSVTANELEKLISGYEDAANTADELGEKLDKMIYGSCLR